MGWFAKKEEIKKRAAKELLASSAGSYHTPPDGAMTTSKYVAPTPVQTAGGQSPVALLADVDEEEMVVVAKHQVEEDYYGDVTANPTSYSGAGESEPEPRSYGNNSKQTHLNSLFNGHLMKWKFEAEEGTSFLRVPAFFGAIALMATAILAVVLYPAAWDPRSIVMTVCVVILALFVIVLEGRFLAPNPLNARAHVRNIMTRNFNILRFVWGRGLLYIIAGTINVAQTWLITIVSGSVMIVLGILAIFVGVHASRKFSALRNSLADESFLLLIFSYYDSDGDGFLVPYQFANLLSYLGMELDDRYALKAFNAIDTNSDRKISFDEFSHWWTSGYIVRGRKDPADEYDEESRHGMT